MTAPQCFNGLLIERAVTSKETTELRIYPPTTEGKLASRRIGIANRPECRAGQTVCSVADSMVQLKLESDHFTHGFSAGVTMQDAPSVQALTRCNDPIGEGSRIVTRFEDPRHGLSIDHILEAGPVIGTLLSWTELTNNGNQPVSTEYLTSFVLSGITPFSQDYAPNRLRVHRFRSWWSNEGRLVSEDIEDLHLERSWAGFNLISERFGQVGTMPVRKYFPFVAIEDKEAGVLWGAQLAWAGSWQMEITRRADTLSISGGLADYEFGHWKKTLQPGESLTTPKAHLACVEGSLSDLTAKLVKLQESLLPEPPAYESELPVIFNEWCTNWGSPSHDKTIAIAKRLAGTGIRYLVIDDGWAVRPPEATMQSNGDWVVDTDKFPEGIDATCKELRALGFTPGIWFEFEVCNPASQAFEQINHHLLRNGSPLRVGNRRFWNLNDPWVRGYLDNKLIQFLKENQLGYLKVDYNDSIGIGCDHPDSLGEGLRQQVNGTHRIFDRIREELPDLVIENCSSGGHRLEPSMMQRTAMSSFSDAHESVNIPIIARQLHHLLPPRQSQIWAVLYPDDTPERMYYSLTATFYGRMCLSGPVHDLEDKQIETIKKAVSFYQKAAPIIKEGKTHFLGEMPRDWTNPSGWSGICRINLALKQALIVVHTYSDVENLDLKIPLPDPSYTDIREILHDATSHTPTIKNGCLHLPSGKPYRGVAILIEAVTKQRISGFASRRTDDGLPPDTPR